MILTSGEKSYLSNISVKIKRLSNLLNSYDLDSRSIKPEHWYQYAKKIKCTLGNFDNDMSFIGCLMAKEFLLIQHDLPELDISSKPQSAPGLDIDMVTIDRERVVAEIKTTIPYGLKDLGAQQKKMFFKDFEKLSNVKAEFKYFFMTEKEAFKIVETRYLNYLKGVNIALLPEAFDNKDYIVIIPSSLTSTNEKIDFQSKNRSTSELIEPKELTLSDSIRVFIRDNFIIPARNAGKVKLKLKSGNIHGFMKLKNRYPAVCSAMKGKKIEYLCHIKIINKEGNDGTNFYVSYEI